MPPYLGLSEDAVVGAAEVGLAVVAVIGCVVAGSVDVVEPCPQATNTIETTVSKTSATRTIGFLFNFPSLRYGRNLEVPRIHLTYACPLVPRVSLVSPEAGGVTIRGNRSGHVSMGLEACQTIVRL
jgi:hypothetical protein